MNTFSFERLFMAAQSTYRKTYPISWDQLHRDSKALAWRLLNTDFFKGIIAITRGGLVPAAIIARELAPDGFLP